MYYSYEITEQINTALENYRAKSEELLNRLNNTVFQYMNESMGGETLDSARNYYMNSVLPYISDQLIDRNRDSDLITALENLSYSIHEAFFNAEAEIAEKIRQHDDPTTGD